MNHLGGNLFDQFSEPAVGEHFVDLLRIRNLRIERIVSSASPDSVPYDQPQDEWVMLLEGQATLQIAGEAVTLGPGDYLLIPARTPHRVLATVPDPRCVWLAVHLYPEDPKAEAM